MDGRSRVPHRPLAGDRREVARQLQRISYPAETREFQLGCGHGEVVGTLGQANSQASSSFCPPIPTRFEKEKEGRGREARAFFACQKSMTRRDQILDLKQRISAAVIGQEAVVEQLLIALLANGHLLMEGLPGLAKTRTIKTLAKNLESQFSRIQFTPDLLPSDITGTEFTPVKAREVRSCFSKDPSLAISSSRTKSTEHPPRRRQPCLKRWKSGKSPSPARRTSCPTFFSFCHAKSYRAGRHLSAARSPDGSLSSSRFHRLLERR